MTPEEMQARILELEAQNAALAAEKGSLQETTSSQEKRIGELQEHNQKLFMKLTVEPKKEEEEEKAPTIDELAETLLKG